MVDKKKKARKKKSLRGQISNSRSSSEKAVPRIWVLPKYLIFTVISVCIWINENRHFSELIGSIHGLRHTDLCISFCKPGKCVALLGLLKYHSNIWERKHSQDVVGSRSKEAAKEARMEDRVRPIGYDRGVECLSPPCLSTNTCY